MVYWHSSSEPRVLLTVWKHRHTHTLHHPCHNRPSNCLSSRGSGSARSTSRPQSNIHPRFRVPERRFEDEVACGQCFSTAWMTFDPSNPTHLSLFSPIVDHPPWIPPSVRKPGFQIPREEGIGIPGCSESTVFQSLTFTSVRPTYSLWRRMKAGGSITGSLSGFSLGHNLWAEFWWSHIAAIYKEGQLTNCIIYQPIENTSQSHSSVLSWYHLLAFTLVVKMSSHKPE